MPESTSRRSTALADRYKIERLLGGRALASTPLVGMWSVVAMVISVPVASATLSAQTLPVGSINLYGVRSLSAESVRTMIGIRHGDPQPSPREITAIERRLSNIPGVVAAEVSVVCCEEGQVNVFVGIAEDSAAIIRFRAPPSSSIRLPNEMLAAGRDFEHALINAVRSGNNRDDLSQGHSLLADSAARAVQERFIEFAERHLDVLRDVLRSSSDADERALAALIVGYAADKRTVLDDLLYAAWDADDDVRNNATRALTAIALFGNSHPELGIRISPDPFIRMLKSVSWSDRNKSSAVLTVLTKPRDSALLEQLRAEALDAMIEMAQWEAIHAGFAFVILGRIAGLPEDRLLKARPSRAARHSLLAEALTLMRLSPS